jgi:hypothetical protein
MWSAFLKKQRFLAISLASQRAKGKETLVGVEKQLFHQCLLLAIFITIFWPSSGHLLNYTDGPTSEAL